jgi:putative glycerol-1-phosphate prenyltransferase
MKTLDKFLIPQKQLAVLIDPDKLSDDQFAEMSKIAGEAGVNFLFVGGSLLTSDTLFRCVRTLKENSDIPVVLFPGNTYQISRNADAILFLSLISGRNPDMLIGMHVISAPYIKLSGLEAIPTGYMLIDSGKPTSVTYMSNSMPIPRDKNDIAACTAMAGEMLGLRLIYMDAGSGADVAISEEMISFVKGSIDAPLIIGGGVRSPQIAEKMYRAGADTIVIGNHFEENPKEIFDFMEVVHKVNGQ